MNGIIKFIEEFSRRYDEFGRLDAYTCRYQGRDHSDDIEASLQSILATFKYCKIPVEEGSSKFDPKCVKSFKFLLLNTNFECLLNHLTRDPKNGGFAGMVRRNMTLYSLMEIVVYLEYEQILAESLLHIPLDLCIEILEVVKNNIFLLDFERRLDLIIAIILNCHKNLIVAWKIGTQSQNLEKNLESLMIYVQQFMAFLTSPKFLKLNEVENLQKSERIGIILKKIIALTYKCLSGNYDDSLSSEIAESYRLVFGDDPIERSKDNFDPQLRILNQEFMHILLKKLEEIDDECYDHWVDLETSGNTSVSLQRSIRNDLYCFMEFLKVYRNFVYYKHFMELMRKFNPQPVDIVSALNLDGLCYGSLEIKIESMRSVLYRYREWDHETFDLIQRNRILIDSNDISYLIDYLELIMRKPCQEYHKRHVFVTIRRVLYQQVVFDDWAPDPIDSWDEESNCSEERKSNDSRETELNEYWKPDILECLNSAYSEDNFKNFVAINEDLKSPKHLRTMLLYLLNNPRNVLRILIEVIIGVPDYAHLSIPPEDLIFFYPVIELGSSEMRFLLLEIRTVVIRCDKWDEKKFANLINLMLKKFKFTANDFVNHVFSYWVEKKPKDISTFLQMLKFVQDCITEKCTKSLDIRSLAEVFAQRLTDFRRDLLLPRSVSTEFISEIERTARPYFKVFGKNIRNDISMYELEPIDRFKSPFFFLSSKLRYDDDMRLASILAHFKNECLLGIQRARTRVNGDIEINPDAPTDCRDFEHLKDDFVRYTLIKCSETEMVQFTLDLAEFLFVNYDVVHQFNWFDYIVRLYIETAIYFLECFTLNPPESFACLIRGLAQFITELVTSELKKFNACYNYGRSRMKIKGLRKLYDCYNSLKKNLRVLAESVRHSTFYPLYETLMTIVDDPSLDNEPRGIALCKIRTALEKFGNECLGIAHSEMRFDRAPSDKALRFKRSHDFINECLNVSHSMTDDARQYQSLCATFKLLRTQESLNDQEEIDILWLYDF